MIFSQAVHSNLSTAYFLGPDIAVILLNAPQVHVVKLSSGQDLHNHLIEYCKPVSPFLVFRSISIFSVVTSSVVCRVKAMGFLLVMYRCESRTIKEPEHQKIDAELWCWRRLLRLPWMARRSNQSIVKEINPEYSLEGLMLKLQSFGHMMWRADSWEKILMLGNTESRRRRGYLCCRGGF